MKAWCRKLVDLPAEDSGPNFQFRRRLIAELRKRGVELDLTVIGLRRGIRIWVKAEHLCCARTILAALKSSTPKTPQSSVEQKDGERL